MNKVIAQTQPQFPSPGAAVQPGGKDPWYIITNLVGKDFKVRYRNMSLGVFWSLVNPLIMMAVLTYVFSVIFTRRNIPNFALFLLCGLLPYNFFTLGWSAGTMSVVSNAALIKQIPFQRELVPISVVLANALHYGLQLVLLLTVIVIVVGPNAQWVWLPVVLLLQLTFVCGLSLLSSALNVYFGNYKERLTNTSPFAILFTCHKQHGKLLEKPSETVSPLSNCLKCSLRKRLPPSGLNINCGAGTVAVVIAGA